MDAIEFQTSVQDGSIQIPQQYQQALEGTDTVKVTVQKVVQKRISEDGIIARLRKEPKLVKEYKFLTREEAHERSL